MFKLQLLCFFLSFFIFFFFLAHVCPNVVWQSIEPCSIHEVSAAVSILLSVIRENAEKERLPRESQLCCLFSFSFSFPWKLWLIHSSHFSPAFHSPDSVTISHSTRRDFLCTCLCRLRYAGAPPLAPPLPSAGVRLGAEKKKPQYPTGFICQPADCRSRYGGELRNNLPTGAKKAGTPGEC